MKQNVSNTGFRLQALRKARHLTQESLASKCQAQGFPISRNKLAKYELGMTEVPARFIPFLAVILNVNITDLLQPIVQRSHAELPLEPLQKPLVDMPAKATQRIDAPVVRFTGATIEMQSHRTKKRPMVSFSTTLQIPLKSLLAEWWESL